MKNKIIEEIQKSKNRYNRLILIVGPYNSGKTSLLRDIGRDLNNDVININLELSRLLLNMSKKERMFNAQKVLNEIIENNSEEGGVVLLDNIEILFDVEVKIDPLKTLKDLARHYFIVSTWSGRIENDFIIYGQIGHREYRKNPANDLITFTMG